MNVREMELKLQEIELNLDAHVKEDILYRQEMTNVVKEMRQQHIDFMNQIRPMTDFFTAGGMVKRGFLSVVSVLATLLAIGYGMVQIIEALFKYLKH